MQEADPFPPLELAADDPARTALELLSDHVRALVEEDACVGAELHVIRGRRTVLHVSHGQADREAERPLALDSVFCVRSMTKPLVGTAVQMLLDEGRLALDTRVAELLPAFDRPDPRGITIEQLMTHTSGLTMSAIAQPLSSYGSVADVAAEAAAHGLEFEPGTAFNYSDAGADTLGAVVAKVSGMPIEDFVQRRMLDPLGMTESLTLLAGDDPRRVRIPSAYSGGPGAWARHWGPDDEPIFPLFLTSQGLYSTTRDYARFLALWMDGGRVGERRLVSEEAVERALTPRNRMADYPSGFRGVETHYAQQWLVYLDEETGARRAFGHNGSDGTHAWAWPEEDLMVLFFTQSRGTMCGLALESVLQELLIDGDVEGYRARTRRKAESLVDLERFEGLYLDETNARAYYVVSADDSQLYIERPGKFRVRLTPTGDDGRFILEGDTALTFEPSADGPSPAFLFPSGGQIEREVRHVPAADLPDVDAVLERIRAAHGIEHLAELGVVRMTGTIELPQRKLSGTVELLFDAERCRLAVDLGVAQSTLWVTADGRAFTQEGEAEPTEAEGAARRDVLATHPAYRHGGWERMGLTVEILRRIESGDRSVLLLRTTSDEAPGASRIIEEETGLLRFEDRLEQIPGVGILGVEVSYGDFRPVGAAMLPFAIRSKYAFALLGEINVQYEEAEVGVEIGAALDPPVASSR
jgi:CubicO group peptidase (beta-lactamase class C family)